MRRLASVKILASILALAAFAAYANHFQNGFHFDDFHTVTDNVFIRDMANVPRFFADASLSSTLPDHHMYRPLVTSSLALDYWLGHGLTPVWFHIGTFLLFELQLVLMFLLFRRIMESAIPGPGSLWTAFFATLCYALHPANAETVNYVIQRADLYCTLGVVAGLVWFASQPAGPRYGWYMIPPALAYLSKPPALVFPFILLFYVFLIEQNGAIVGGDRAAQKARWIASLRAALPAFVITAVFAVLQARMTPPSFQAGAQSPWLYRITQPYVAVYYFKSFFLPTELSADTDWGYVRSPFSTNAVTGYVLVALLVWAAVRCTRRHETRPIAFGLLWFLIALLPTSLMPLAEVTNDHRMFFPFVGLSLAVFWSLRLALDAHPAWRRLALAGLVLIFAAEAAGTHQRNQVWRTEESLWRDVVAKSPENGRGMMNYGLVLMSHANYSDALAYFERALAFTPNYPTLEINLGIVNGGLHRDAEAERHFERALNLAPNSSDSYYYYARWLHERGRTAPSANLLQAAIAKNPMDFNARHLLLIEYAELHDEAAVQALARETLQLAPTDDVAPRYVAWRAPIQTQPAAPPTVAATPPAAGAPAPATPEQLLAQSLDFYRSRQYFECILSAMKALKLRPAYAAAYNNIAAANNAMGRWDEGIRNAREALRIDPQNTLAQNNLQWALKQKQLQPR